MKYKYTKTFRHNGKRYYIYGNTLAEVSRKMVAKQKALADQTAAENHITVAAWTDRCIPLYKSNQTEATRKKYVKRIEHSILESIGALPMQAVTGDQLQLCMNQQAGRSRTQINEIFYALRFIFSHAAAAGVISADPSIHLTKPKAKKSESRRALTETERAAFLACATKERKYFGFLLSYYCGLRPGEASGCKGADIIVKDGLRLLHVKGTKTAFSDRFVPIPAQLYDIIRNTPKTENIALYPSGLPISYDNRSHLWSGLIYKMNVEAGAVMYRNRVIEPAIGTDLVPYCLRHDYCTRLARAGVDIRTAQKLMGHATISMTADIYTHVDQTDIETAAKLIDGFSTTASTTSE